MTSLTLTDRTLPTPSTSEPCRTRELIELNRTGDTKLIWDPDKAAEVDAARAMFDSLKKKNYLAYRVDRKGEKGEVIKEFDPNAEKIILAPQMVGG
jgi:hypothetical protein